MRNGGKVLLKIVKVIGLVALIVMSGMFLFQTISSLGDNDEDEINEEGNSEQDVVYDMEEFVEGRIFLGDEDAESEMIFVLDYMCPYCKEWYRDVFPKVKEEYIDTGKVKLYFQPQVFLGKKSLALTEFTQKVEKLYPEKYFELIDRMEGDYDLEHWGTEEYILEVSEELELIGWDEVELDYDVIRKTRQVTRGLNVEVVPTIIINGHHVSDSSDYEEIKTLITETKNAKWKVTGELCDEDGENC